MLQCKLCPLMTHSSLNELSVTTAHNIVLPEVLPIRVYYVQCTGRGIGTYIGKLLHINVYYALK